MVFPRCTLLFALFAGGCRHTVAATPEPDLAGVGQRLEEFRRRSLDPAKIPPPSVTDQALEVSVGTVHGTARWVRAEDAEWNQWPGDGPRLFNNRAALVVAIRVVGTGPIRWVPAATRLEVNDSRTSLLAAASGEPLIGELLVNAFLEERYGFAGDLVERTRAAGAFRSAYLPLTSAAGVLDGVLAFPLVSDGRAIGDDHLVALRLTVSVVGEADGPATLSWVFE